MKIPEKIVLIILSVLIIFCSVLLYFILYYSQVNNANFIQKGFVEEGLIEKRTILSSISEISINNKLSDSPKIIKAVYVTSWSARSKQYLKYLETLFETTEINAVVIDIKDYTGHTITSDIDGLIKELHSKGIYVIGRIVVFEDPIFARTHPNLAVYDESKTTDTKNPVLWTDNHNLQWVDPASKEYWDYNISIAKDAINHGFDELNFDYIRFPSDGQTKNMGFPFWDKKVPMHLVIKEFFQNLRESLPEAKLSADLFGYSAVAINDMGIGQILEDSFDYFDYISLMVYPSHYTDGFQGYPNPAEYPYEVIKYSMDEALKRQTEYYNKLEETKGMKISNRAKFRPWLQDFDMGADYNEEMVKAEIKATADSLGEDFNGFMLWNPSNIYTTGAVKNSPQ